MWGSAVYRDQVLDEDAGPIDRLRKGGAVLAAKLATMELAGFHGTVAEASVHGPGLNPWDRTRWSAGSSSGSGAAVGAGLIPYALGTETGGSIGSPSAFCGVTGLRPTFGLVGRHGVMPLVWSLDKVGPIARSVSDCALVLEVISGTTVGTTTRPTPVPASAGRGCSNVESRSVANWHLQVRSRGRCRRFDPRSP